MDHDPPATALRTGWTTGACATAAARAAAERLFLGQFADPVTITLPKGERPSFPLVHRADGPGWAEAGVEKDAGDDPDVTHGATVIARVEHGPPGMTFLAGEGVGTVTKPGLPIAVGEPAINPVPRQMIHDTLAEVAAMAGVPLACLVTVSIPGGAEIAARTWNPRLGIVGGLSILGTTGIVRPFSCAAWIASIHRGIDVARANGLEHVAAATGSTSERTVQGLYPDLPEIAYLDMGDFAGGMLKYLRRHPIPRLTLAGGIGKLTKLSQGALDLHSKRSQVDFAGLASLATTPELATQIRAANTALEAVEIGGPPLAEAVARRARETVLDTLRGAEIEVEVLVTDRAGTVLARKGFD